MVDLLLLPPMPRVERRAWVDGRDSSLSCPYLIAISRHLVFGGGDPASAAGDWTRSEQLPQTVPRNGNDMSA